ncbi:unnamed protein product [Amoebophrya sp. A25]|nr:unnamed protein product [Amoebophrya sp. A25]|eukprot:GSA25T00026882001.1
MVILQSKMARFSSLSLTLALTLLWADNAFLLEGRASNLGVGATRFGSFRKLRSDPAANYRHLLEEEGEEDDTAREGIARAAVTTTATSAQEATATSAQRATATGASARTSEELASPVEEVPCKGTEEGQERDACDCAICFESLPRPRLLNADDCDTSNEILSSTRNDTRRTQIKVSATTTKAKLPTSASSSSTNQWQAFLDRRCAGLLDRRRGTKRNILKEQEGVSHLECGHRFHACCLLPHLVKQLQDACKKYDSQGPSEDERQRRYLFEDDQRLVSSHLSVSSTFPLFCVEKTPQRTTRRDSSSSATARASSSFSSTFTETNIDQGGHLLTEVAQDAHYFYPSCEAFFDKWDQDQEMEETLKRTKNKAGLTLAREAKPQEEQVVHELLRKYSIFTCPTCRQRIGHDTIQKEVMRKMPALMKDMRLFAQQRSGSSHEHVVRHRHVVHGGKVRTKIAKPKDAHPCSGGDCPYRHLFDPLLHSRQRRESTTSTSNAREQETPSSSSTSAMEQQGPNSAYASTAQHLAEAAENPSQHLAETGQGNLAGSLCQCDAAQLKELIDPIKSDFGRWRRLSSSRHGRSIECCCRTHSGLSFPLVHFLEEFQHDLRLCRRTARREIRDNLSDEATSRAVNLEKEKGVFDVACDACDGGISIEKEKEIMSSSDSAEDSSDDALEGDVTKLAEGTEAGSPRKSMAKADSVAKKWKSESIMKMKLSDRLRRVGVSGAYDFDEDQMSEDDETDEDERERSAPKSRPPLREDRCDHAQMKRLASRLREALDLGPASSGGSDDILAVVNPELQLAQDSSTGDGAAQHQKGGSVSSTSPAEVGRQQEHQQQQQNAVLYSPAEVGRWLWLSAYQEVRGKNSMASDGQKRKSEEEKPCPIVEDLRRQLNDIAVSTTGQESASSGERPPRGARTSRPLKMSLDDKGLLQPASRVLDLHESGPASIDKNLPSSDELPAVHCSNEMPLLLAVSSRRTQSEESAASTGSSTALQLPINSRRVSSPGAVRRFQDAALYKGGSGTSSAVDDAKSAGDAKSAAGSGNGNTKSGDRKASL